MYHTNYLIPQGMSEPPFGKRKLYKITLFFGIPKKLIRLTKVTMEDSAFQVKIQTELTEPTTTKKGSKQGDGLAPVLFNIVLEYIIRRSNKTLMAL
jgi:hypothetical protein